MSLDIKVKHKYTYSRKKASRKPGVGWVQQRINKGMPSQSSGSEDGNTHKRSRSSAPSPTEEHLFVESTTKNEADVAAEVAEAAAIAGLDMTEDSVHNLSEHIDAGEPSQLELMAMFTAQHNTPPSSPPEIELLPIEQDGPPIQDMVQELDLDVATCSGNDALAQSTEAAQQECSAVRESTTYDTNMSEAIDGPVSSRSDTPDKMMIDDHALSIDTTSGVEPMTEPAPSFPRFQDCPEVVRRQILEDIVPTNRIIKPFYNHGSVSVQPYDDAQEDADLSFLFVGNKQYYEDASAVLYGLNFFRFDEPKIALWWLRRIGSNLGKMKRAIFDLTEGVSNHPSDCVGVRFEKQWSMLFHWLRPRHKLREIQIFPEEWYDSGFLGHSLVFEALLESRKWFRSGPGLRASLAREQQTRNAISPPDQDLSPQYVDIEKPRDDAFMCLLSYRGLDMAHIEPRPDMDSSSSMCELIQGAMELEPGETTPEIEQVMQQYEAALARTGKKRRKYDMS